ncbi:MAG TPA: PAS domain-containing sensor histidine kinase [Puia sp.]|nr:PAS domain-containing sensor histidine kinase [Puia sp.]
MERLNPGGEQGSAAQINALFEFATEGIILTDEQGGIILANPAALHLFNYTKEELIGRSIEALIPLRFREHHLHYRHAFNEHPANRTMGHGRDLFAITKEGREFPVEVSLSFYHREGTLFVIAFIVDITQRKEAEQNVLAQRRQLEQITAEMRMLNAELENKVEQRTMILQEALRALEKSQRELSDALNKEKELNEIKSRFVSMASHEFRTPLSTVLSSASLISKYTHTEEQDKRDKHILRIKDSVKHLNNLLEDFLSLGRLDEGRVNVDQARFNLKEFIADTVDELKPSLKTDQTIVEEYEGAEFIATDRRLLKNILLNLLGNAIKFSGEGSRIQLKLQQDAQYLHITVSDQGVGISEEDQQHLFSSFFRGKNVTNIEGTGLGLHIVKRYIDLLEGEIGLESALNSGTKVEVRLPVKKP